MSTEARDGHGDVAAAAGAGLLAGAAPVAPAVTDQQAADWVIRERLVPLLRELAATEREEEAA